MRCDHVRCSMPMTHARRLLAALSMVGLLSFAVAATADEKRYAPGVSDTEIKLGQTMPYSGPVSATGAIGLAELAYIRMLNEHGGVNGRKIRLISLDDS